LIPGNGLYDRIWICFNVSKSTKVQMTIFDMSGRTQRVLLSGEALPPGKASVPWDGRDDDGVPLSSGPYLVQVEAEEANLREGVVIWRQ
jgi:flagellar hook assembly protein FlgD